MQPPGGETFLAQKALHHPTSRKRILHVQRVDPAHQLQIARTDRARLIV